MKTLTPYDRGVIPACASRPCSGYFDTIGQPAPDGVVQCDFPVCSGGSQSSPKATDDSRPCDDEGE